MKTMIYIACLLSFMGGMAQHSVTGTVTDFNGDGLLGVTVAVNKTTNTVTTDFDGKYAINAKKTDTLVFKYLGYETQLLAVNNKKVLNVVLLSGQLDAVVVQGYRTTKAQRSTVASSTIKTETISHRRNASMVQTLNGQVQGLNIQSSNGQPGANSIVQLRGIASLKYNTEPLFVIDGQPVDENKFRGLNPKDIKAVEVIKDASSTAIYGNRGANGVVVVTTKKGSPISHHNTPEPEIVNESYKEIIENPFETSLLKPLSTFSIDVDKAGYSNIRRFINNGQQIPTDAVKIEEMINYFNYSYPQPTGDVPFSINSEVVQTPWNKDSRLVRIGLQGKTYLNEDLPASNLTFLIDVSGSMGNANKLPLLKQSFKLLVNQLRDQDRIAIVVYAGAAGVVLEPTKGSEKEKIIAALDNLQAGGSTAGGAGIELAYKLAAQNYKQDGNNRVILATDGDFNVGMSSDKSMEALIEKKRESGVFLSVLGFGMGNYKDSKLETLADKGNGNHAYIDNLLEAQKVFGKEFGGTLYTIAKDVKIQVEFNPSLVQAYRLIGYENRLLAAQDFVDDTKDAGELGSGHTVTALYEIIPVGAKSTYATTLPDLKYVANSSNEQFNDELYTFKLRYKEPNGSTSKELVQVQKNEITTATTDMHFAAAVALYGMQLKQSNYKGTTTTADVLALAKKGLNNDTDGYKAEFLRLVETYAGYN